MADNSSFIAECADQIELFLHVSRSVNTFRTEETLSGTCAKVDMQQQRDSTCGPGGIQQKKQPSRAESS